MKLGLTQGLRRAAQVKKNAVAVTDPETSYSWGALIGRISRLASGLRGLGMKPGDRVAYLAHNDHRSLELFFAVLWAGGIMTPISIRLRADEINVQLSEVEPRVLVCGPEFAATAERLAVPALLPITGAGDGKRGMPDYESLIAASEPMEDCRRAGADIACIFFTGGTTGAPKGVMLSHDNIVANSINFIAHTAMDDDTVHLHCGPLYHVAAAVRFFSVTHACGRHVILPGFDAGLVLETISRERVTLATLVPTMLQAVLERQSTGCYDLGSLRHITYGAAPMPESLLKQALAALPGVDFIQSYGMTETSPIATMLGAAEHREPAGDRLRSAGRAALLTEVRIVDAGGNPLPPHQTGEIAVRGPNVMPGYWNRPEATAEAIRNGWMHTGDLGYMDEEGYLFVVDRLKDVIISGGENVYSQEVENTIMKLPQVSNCAVIGLPDEKWGERVHAVVVPQRGAEQLDEETVILFCKERLAGYKCPKSVSIRHTPLPLSGANKVLKPQLREEIIKGASLKAPG